MISSRLRPPSIEALREAVHRCPASKFSKGAIRSDFTFPKCNSCRYQSAARNCPPLAVTALSVAAQAQEDWQVDPKDSVATLSLGEGVNTLQIGLTRVTGYVEFRSSGRYEFPGLYNGSPAQLMLLECPVSNASLQCLTLRAIERADAVHMKGWGLWLRRRI
jgi:hypothetical protein